MSFLDTLARIPKILESNINALLDHCEDPAKMIDQLLIDYKRDLADVKKDTAAVMADKEMAKKKVDDCLEDIAKKTKAAENALKAGAEEDAKKLIAAKQNLETTLVSLQENLALAEKNEQLMKEGYEKLVRNIDELETRKDAAKAKLSMAKAQEAINKTVSLAGDTRALDSFARYEEKAEKAYQSAAAAAKLDSEVMTAEDLTDKYAGDSTASVDDELAAMKAQLGL